MRAPAFDLLVVAIAALAGLIPSAHAELPMSPANRVGGPGTRYFASNGARAGDNSDSRAAKVPFQARLAVGGEGLNRTNFNFPQANFSTFGNIFCPGPDSCTAIGTSNPYYSEPETFFSARWGVTYKPPSPGITGALGSWVDPQPSSFTGPGDKMIYSPQHIKCASTFCATMTVFDNGTRRIWKYSKAPYHFETMLDIPTEILPNTTYLGSGEDLACAEKGDYCLIKGWNGLSKNGTDGKEQWIGSVGAFTISNGTLKPVRLGPMFKKVYAFAFKKKNFENSMYYFGHQLACLPSGSKCFAEIIPKTVIKKVLGKNSWYQAVYDRKTNLFELAPMRFAKGTTFEKDVELKALDGFSNEIATCVTDTFCFTGIAVYVGGFYDAGGYVGAMFWNGKVWTMMPEGRVDFPQERLPAYRNMNFFVGVFGVECISTKACFMFGALEAAQGWNGYEAVGDFVFIYDTGKPKVPQLVRSSLAPRNGTRRFFHGMKCVPQRKVCHLAMWSSQLPSSMWAITPK